MTEIWPAGPPKLMKPNFSQNQNACMNVGAIGVAAALVLTRVLASLLYGVERTDPLAMTGAVTLLLVVGMAAAFLPARRASRTDPALVLRQ